MTIFRMNPENSTLFSGFILIKGKEKGHKNILKHKWKRFKIGENICRTFINNYLGVNTHNSWDIGSQIVLNCSGLNMDWNGKKMLMGRMTCMSVIRLYTYLDDSLYIIKHEMSSHVTNRQTEYCCTFHS